MKAVAIVISIQAAAVLLLAGTHSVRADVPVTILHNFADDDGHAPYTTLSLVGSTLFGTTIGGGASTGGTVFRLNTDGTGFASLHSFSLTDNEGWAPNDTLATDGSTLFGMTNQTGNTSNGTVFSLGANGTGYAVLHTLSGSEGSNAQSGLTLGGTRLYGSGNSTLFSLNTDGTGFSVLHTFSGPDGSQAISPLLLVGSKVYGSTYTGGSSGYGTVFSMNTDGSGFGLLHSFTDTDGYPKGQLTLVGSTLYGTTESGAGTVFRLNTDGSGFSVLHSFTGVDGGKPEAGLALVGSTLYGTTSGVFNSGNATVFAIGLDGSAFSVLHTFSGAPDGALPFGALTSIGSTLYGTTSFGGLNNSGTVFAINVPEPSSLLLTGLAIACCGGYSWRRLRARAPSIPKPVVAEQRGVSLPSGL